MLEFDGSTGLCGKGRMNKLRVIGALLLKIAGKPNPIPIHVVAFATNFIKLYFPTELPSPYTKVHNVDSVIIRGDQCHL